MNSPQSVPAAPEDRPGPDGSSEAGGVSSGVLGARPLQRRTFRGGDPDTVVASAISRSTPTKCQARTRLYRGGTLELEGFPVVDISDYLGEEGVTISVSYTHLTLPTN